MTRPSVVPHDGQRHRRDPAVVGAAVVEGGGEPLAHLAGERGVVEGVRVDGEQPLALAEQLVQVGQEADALAVRPGRGQAPVQCAPMPPTLLDMAAPGRPSSPGCW